MKSKAPLLLMEQAIMVLVFALAAALCVRVFVWAQLAAGDNAQQDRALVCAQNAGQILKGFAGDYGRAAQQYGGSWNGTVWTVGYDDQWLCKEEAAVYELTLTPVQSGRPLLGQAQVVVTRLSDRRQLAGVTVSWQEVAGDG